MANYVIEKDGYAVNVILSDSGEIATHIAAQQGATARLLGENEVPIYASPPSAPREITLTQLAFLRRFTAQERIAIRSSSDPVIIDFLHLVNLAQDVNLDDLDTVAGLAYLEAQQLIAQGRAAEIRGL